MVVIPWTNNAGFSTEKGGFVPGTGFADSSFSTKCGSCNRRISHDYLRIQKFRADIQLLLRSDLPLPGTIINSNGKIVKHDYKGSKLNGVGASRNLFPSTLAKQKLSAQLLDITHPSREFNTMNSVKTLFEPEVTKETRGNKRGERLAFRRMMSRYWYNSSPFALDLTGAVVRQGIYPSLLTVCMSRLLLTVPRLVH